MWYDFHSCKAELSVGRVGVGAIVLVVFCCSVVKVFPFEDIGKSWVPRGLTDVDKSKLAFVELLAVSGKG